MHPTDDEFLRQAELCRNVAARAATEQLRMGWLRLAAEWQAMTEVHGTATEPFDFAADNAVCGETPANR